MYFINYFLFFRIFEVISKFYIAKLYIFKQEIIINFQDLVND